MPNRFGQSYALTVLSPVIGGHTHGFAHATAIRTALARLSQGAKSPFATIDTLHMARLVVLDDLRLQGTPAKEDHLRSKYLVFVADFTGDLPAFVTALATRAGAFVTEVWQHCEGFPGVADVAAFQRYIERCQIPSTFPFGAYPKSSLADVLRALDTQRRLIGFLEQFQGAPPAELQQAFRTFVTELQHAPLPAPGSI
jgi:hypothetical protein